MAPAPYQRLYNDIEDGLTLNNSDQFPAHDHPSFSDRLRSLPALSISSLSILLPAKSTFQRLSAWRRSAMITSCFLTLGALVILWSATSDSVIRLAVGPHSSPPHLSLVLWPRPEDAEGDYSVRYTYLPLDSSLNATTAPQSPPSHIPLAALAGLLDPSSLSEESASGVRLPEELSAFFNQPIKFDIVWTWVNGSDPLHREALTQAEREMLVRAKRALLKRSNSGKSSALVEPTTAELSAAIRARASSSPKLYRDHDELRYSIRSALQYFGPHLGRLHVLSGDFNDPRIPARKRNDSSPPSDKEEVGAGEFDGLNRLGQIPQWLGDDVDVLRRNDEEDKIHLQFHHHSQFFAGYEKPTFNSFAIEAQMARVGGIAEHFVYMNDDYFFYDTVQPADFYTSAYGIVLRFQPDLLVTSANPALDDKHGEWRPLHYSNWLLDERYGKRARPYMQHAPKSLSLPIFRELSIFKDFEHNVHNGVSEEATMTGTFRNALMTTGQHTFRGQYTNVKDHDDAYVMFLFAHHVVERWREILLWSWVIGRIGGSSDEWLTDIQRPTAWAELGGNREDAESGNAAHIKVETGNRETLDRETVLNVLGGQSATVYSFSSLDGYPYAFLGSSPTYSWPQMTPNSQWLYGQSEDSYHPTPAPCQINLDVCFPKSLANATDAFKNVAFVNPQCGDCIIRALVIASGDKGLDAFLPDPSRTAEFSAPSPEADTRDPLLPVRSSWKTINFSLQSVLAPWAKAPQPERRNVQKGTVNVREWVMRAMVRYRFVIGETPFDFLMLTSASRVSFQLGALARKVPRPAMVCVNDDLNESRYGVGSSAIQASKAMKSWMESIWPTKAWWER